MKRISLTLCIAALAIVSAPLSAQGKYDPNSRVIDRNRDGVIDRRDQVNNCSWWEVNCTNTNTRTNRSGTNRSGTNNGGWYQIGSDRNGNAIYERSTFDRKGRETVEIARRERDGRLVIIDRRRVNNQQNNGRYGTQQNNGRYGTQQNNGRYGTQQNNGRNGTRNERRGDRNNDDRNNDDR